MIGTLRGIGDEFVGLLGRTSVTWWRFAPAVVGFMLLGWVGYYGSVLFATEFAFVSPWLVILGLAIGAVVQLAMIVLTLRWVMERSGIQLDAVHQTSLASPVPPVRLLAQTILPFLAIYAAFGFVDDFARNMVLALTGRYGLGSSEFLSALDPTRSTQSLGTVLAIVVGLYLLRRGLDWLADRSERSWIGLVGAVAEASWVLLALLSLFRLAEAARLWLYGRQLGAWWDAAGNALFGWIHLDGLWLAAWEFLAAQAWPALWDVITQPLAWLALAVVVAGIKVATSAELIEQTRGHGGTVATIANGFFAGDLDDKFVPLWHAVRFLAGAGLPLLGGYVLAFTAIDWAGALLQSGLDQLIGPQYGKAALRVMPFYDLLSQVLVLGLRLALLGATVARVGELIITGGAGARPRPRLREALLGFVVCLALALSSLAATPDSGVKVVRGQVGTELTLFSAGTTVGEPRAGYQLVDQSGNQNPTDLVFVVVPVTMFEERGGSFLYATLHAGDRSYEPWTGPTTMLTPPGFATDYDLVFEVAPEHLGDPLMLEVWPSGLLQLGQLRAEVALPAPSPGPEVSYSGLPKQWVP